MSNHKCCVLIRIKVKATTINYLSSCLGCCAAAAVAVIASLQFITGALLVSGTSLAPDTDRLLLEMDYC